MAAPGNLPPAPTLAPLVDEDHPPRVAVGRIAEMGFRDIQLSSTLRGMRPRELDGSGRRDVLALLRRSELRLAGIDCWIPQADFQDDARVDRAVEAIMASIDLAADFGRVPVSLIMPTTPGVADAVVARAQHRNVPIADFAHPWPANAAIGVGLDPAACLSRGEDPAAEALRAGDRLAAARLSDLSSDGLRIAPGDRASGRLDVQAYRVALSVVGCKAAVVMDARQWVDPWRGLSQAREAWIERIPHGM